MPRDKKRKPSRAPAPQQKAEAVILKEPSPTDPLGMYTARPADPLDVPVQDADDL